MVEENVPEEIEDETGKDNMGEKDEEKENKKKDSEAAKKSGNKRKQRTDVELVEPTEQMMEADVEIRHEPKKSRKLKEVDGRMTWNDQKAAYLVDCYATIIRRTAAKMESQKVVGLRFLNCFRKSLMFLFLPHVSKITGINFEKFIGISLFYWIHQAWEVLLKKG